MVYNNFHFIVAMHYHSIINIFLLHYYYYHYYIDIFCNSSYKQHNIGHWVAHSLINITDIQKDYNYCIFCIRYRRHLHKNLHPMLHPLVLFTFYRGYIYLGMIGKLGMVMSIVCMYSLMIDSIPLRMTGIGRGYTLSMIGIWAHFGILCIARRAGYTQGCKRGRGIGMCIGCREANTLECIYL